MIFDREDFNSFDWFQRAGDYEKVSEHYPGSRWLNEVGFFHG